MSRIRAFTALLALMTAMTAVAMPIKPDLHRLLQERGQHRQYFEPAKVGWDGPEMKSPEDASPNPVLEAYGPKATTRAIRASLVAAAIPDPKAVIAIAAMIMLMRMLRSIQERRKNQVRATVATTPPLPERKAA